MAEYTLTGDDGIPHDLSNVTFDEGSGSITFSAPFKSRPGLVCDLRRTRDNALMKVAVNDFNINFTGGVVRMTWSAALPVARR